MNGSRESGFTLLELIIVMVIIGLVMAISYPSIMRGSTALHLRSTGRDVLNTFRYAREKAVTEQIRMKVLVDRDKQQLILTDYFGDGARTYVLPQDIKIKRIALAGDEIADSSMIVRFLPNGSCDTSVVLLQAERGAWIKVFTDPLAGGARMEIGSGESQ
jgi:prepilin-type N-terminal cleavage/methylation domain-containing protein